MSNEKSLTKNIPFDLLLDELRTYGDWDCMKPLENVSKSCPHMKDSFDKWCPSCRAWALLAYYERKLPTADYRGKVANYISDWKKQQKAPK